MEFTNWNWQSYDRLRFDNLAKQKQVRLLYPTGLCEGKGGVEFCFVPTQNMMWLEQKIEDMCSQIKVEDNEIALCDEIFHTSKIEGAKTTFKRTQALHNGEPVDENNYFSEKMVLGGFNATKFLNLHGNRINQDILITMWNILVEGACQNENIRGEKYRTGNVGIGNHMGLNHEFVEDAMEDWIAYYNSDELNDHPFIKAALLHFVFEYIHPFCDGNGRAGRLLMVNYLIGQGYDMCKAVPFYRSIEKNRAAYDNAFTVSENSYSDVTPFIEYLLDIYADAFYDCLTKTRDEKEYEERE